MSKSLRPVAGQPRRKAVQSDAPETLPHLCLDDTCPGATCTALRLVLGLTADRLTLDGHIVRVRADSVQVAARDYCRADIIEAVVQVWRVAGQPFERTSDIPHEYEG